MSDENKYISIKEFVDEGYLQELNRSFLHPLGLALVVNVYDNEIYILNGIRDCRDDPEGIIFDDNVIDVEKFANVGRIMHKKLDQRRKVLGYAIQPITVGVE